MVSTRIPVRFLVLLVVLFWATALDAQLNRGLMEGTVTDPQGAVVPNVQVTVTSVETNIATPTRTNSAGYYRVDALVPGKYLAHFEAAGFTPVDVTNIQVLAGEVMRVDAQLKVGATRQTVEVTAGAPVLETAPANYSTTVETNVIQNVPLQGRDLQQLVFLVPGVTNVGGPPGSNFGFNSQYGSFPDPTYLLGSAVAVNGGQGGANAWYLDGSLNLSSFGENIVVNPIPDVVSEFQVITNGFSAEYGHTGGGVFNVVLKSGTNSLHGNVYEFTRNDFFNARNPFTSIDSFGHIVKQRQLRFNNFGGTLGGPVVLPHIYNGKNRTFFFFSLDATVLHLLGNQTFSVPTALMRQGNFSEDPGIAQFGIYDPYTSAGPNSQGTFDRTAFGTSAAGDSNGCLASHISASGGASCVTSPIIPSGRLDPTAMFFINSFPNPNYLDPLSGCPLANGGGYRICNNFLGAVGSSQDPLNLSIKIDHQWSDKNKYFFEWLFTPGKYRNYRVPWTGPTFPQSLTGYGSNFPTDFANQIFTIGNTYAVTPTLVNEFRASFSRQFLTTHPLHPYPESITAQTQVKQHVDPLQIMPDPADPYPEFTIYSPGYMDWGLTAWVNELTSAEAFTFTDNLTKVIGRHTLKTGYMYRLEHGSHEATGSAGLAFSGGITNNPLTYLGGDGLAQFMLGAVSSGDYNYSYISANPYERWREWSAYVQDDFRITRNFTLNLGLRYDLNGYFKARWNPMERDCLTCFNPLSGLQGRIVYQGQPGFPAGGDIEPANHNGFGPRLNFAWTPTSDKKTVVRGGYDIFYTNAIGNVNSTGQTILDVGGWAWFGFFNGSWYPNQCERYTGQCLAFPLSDTTAYKAGLWAIPYRPGQPYPAQTRTLYPSLTGVIDTPPRDPMQESWNFEIQHEFPSNLSVTIGYVGTHGTHLAGDGFSPAYGWLSTANKLKYKNLIYSNYPISQFYSGQTAKELGIFYGSPGPPVTELPLGTLLLPNPFGFAYSASSMLDGSLVYHAMNLRVQKRYSHGLNFIVAYTVSKKISNSATDEVGSSVLDPIHWARSGLFGGRTGTVGGVFGAVAQNLDNKRADRAVAADDIPQMLNVAFTYELPLGSGKAFLNRRGIVNGALGGWKLSGNLNAESGIPLSIACPGNALTTRCDLVGDPKFSGNRSKAQRISQWINPAAFEPPFGSDQSFWANYNIADPRAWQFGTAGARLPGIRSPGFWNVDTALAKDFHFSEARYFEFRWEAFNALNHQNLGFPNTYFCLPPTANGSTDLVHQAGCSFGRITNIQTDPRSMEFALKFYW